MTCRSRRPWPRRVRPCGTRPSCPGGASLAELVLVALLLALVLLAVARIAASQGRLARTVRERTRSAEALRTTSVVLGGELRYLARPDIAARAGDSIRIRAMRGSGALCATGSDYVVVAFRGVRRPEPDKDSVLLVSAAGTDGGAHAVLAVTGDARCGGGLRLRTAPGPGPEAAFALVYESGAYHLNAGALRYRRGRGGRQPLSESVFASGRFTPYGPGGVRANITFRADSLATVGQAVHVVPSPSLNPWLP